MGFTAMNRGQRGKLAMATAALAIGLLSVTGCGYINPQQTTEHYAASDGTQANVGPLQLRNMMIISGGEDKPGRVIGAVYNSSSEDVTLTIVGAAGSQTRIPVKQNSYTLLNDSTDEAILSTTGGAPGPSSRSASPKTAPTRTPSSRFRYWTGRSPTTSSTCRQAASPQARPRRRRPRRRRAAQTTRFHTQRRGTRFGCPSFCLCRLCWCRRGPAVRRRPVAGLPV